MDFEDFEEPTRFAETNALLAVGSGNETHARKLLADMTKTELRELDDTLDELAGLIGEELKRR